MTRKQLKSIGAGNLGDVRIGFLGSAMQEVIPKLLLQLKVYSSGIKTTLEELSNRAQVDAILKDNLDIGFVRLARVPKGVKIAPVHQDTFSVVLPQNHILNSENFKNMGQLIDEDFILFKEEYSPLYYDTVMSICEDAGFTPKVSHKSVHAQTIFKLVENNLGIAIVPTSLQHGFQMNVKFIELKKIRQKAVLSVIWKEDNRNPALQKCMNFVLGNK